MRWKLVGLAGLAGVTATGVVIARRRREHREYDPDELRARLHERLRSAAPPADGGGGSPAERAASSERAAS